MSPIYVAQLILGVESSLERGRPMTSHIIKEHWFSLSRQLLKGNSSSAGGGISGGLPHSCWDVVCIDFVQVIHMLSQLLWCPVCNGPIINDFGSSLTHCFPNFRAERITWKLFRYTVGFISDSKSVAQVGSKKVHVFLTVFQMGQLFCGSTQNCVTREIRCLRLVM